MWWFFGFNKGILLILFLKVFLLDSLLFGIKLKQITMKDIKQSRKNFIKTISLGIIGTRILTSCNNTKTQSIETKSNVMVSDKPLKPVLTKVGQNQKAPDGIDFGFKLRSSQTNGQYSCTEETLPAKTLGVHLHMHDKLDEIMRVLEGTVHVLVGEEVFEINAGEWHLRPHGIPHTYWNQTNKPAKLIDMFLNQDFDNFLDELLRISKKLKSQNISPDSPQATELYSALDKKYGITSYHDKTKELLEKYNLKMADF